MNDRPNPSRWTPSIPSGQLFGWGLVALVNAVWIAAFVPMPIHGWQARLGHHAYDAAQLLALGTIAFVLAAVWSRVRPRARFATLIALFVGALLVAWFVLDEDTSVLVGKASQGVPVLLVRGALSAAVAVTIPAAWLAGVPLRGRYLRLVGVGLASGVAVANQILLAHDYPGVHFFFAWIAATLAASALCDPSVVLSRRLGLWVARGAVAVVGLLALVVPPSNAVGLQLYRSSGSVVAPLLARLRESRVQTVAWTTGSNPWFTRRDGFPAVPPSAKHLLADDAIVILLSVDCLRADLLDTDTHIARWPAFKRLRDEAVRFEEARTVAPATAQAVTAMFASRYYSELYWTPLPKVNKVYVFPHQDPSPRFPELLSAAGVRTVSVQGLPGVTVETGLTRGMTEETVLPIRGDFPGVREQMPVLIQRLGEHPAGRQFLYAHFADPHAPYNRGGRPGTDFERYLDEVDLVDRGLGQLVQFLEQQKLWARTTVVLTADHGEAFGEHDSRLHATTLYGEVLRVPLLMRIPGVTPHVVHERVSLLDFGPTFLDLFGIATPGVYLGQSLVPLIRGEHVELTRPLAAESARHMRAMIFPDGIEVIEDFRKHTVEVYDLARDPGELRNLYTDNARASGERLARMRAFFASHELHRPGYTLPFER